ncbi:AAA family ATPase [Pectobacterium brasiliense]|uniref:AAA family ATPase n=1 Tax=Pectobacterium brasiliense TaxID=180957 RepID=UPI001F3F98D6|nr:AAA family ATPase [Pectobacterium brasiliense]
MPTNPALLWKLVFRSLAKSPNWKTAFESTVQREGLPLALCWQQTDKSDRSEGLYLKVEDDEQVLVRYKLVRHDFIQTILDSDSHHSRRPILPNQLAEGVDLYAPFPTFTIRELSWQLSIPLVEADMRGRICQDQTRVLDSIELFREQVREEGCYGQPRSFVDAHTRLSHFRGADVHPDYPLFQEPGSKVTVMCGLPASGKDTWVRTHRHDLPVVSFDDARIELGLKHGENEGKAVHWTTDKARSLLRTHEPFVWNVTHLSQQIRILTLDLCYAYGAEVEIVYLERLRQELLRRNGKQDSTLSNKTLQGMLTKWELPTPTEAHVVRYER